MFFALSLWTTTLGLWVKHCVIQTAPGKGIWVLGHFSSLIKKSTDMFLISFNEYARHMFLWRTMKNIIWKLLLIWSYVKFWHLFLEQLLEVISSYWAFNITWEDIFTWHLISVLCYQISTLKFNFMAKHLSDKYNFSSELNFLLFLYSPPTSPSPTTNTVDKRQ